jgi:hypothetical protein
MLFFNYWNGCLSNTSANPDTDFKPNVYSNQSMHLTETNNSAEPRNLQLKIVVGLAPEADVYKFEIPY